MKPPTGFESLTSARSFAFSFGSKYGFSRNDATSVSLVFLPNATANRLGSVSDGSKQLAVVRIASDETRVPRQANLGDDDVSLLVRM